MMTAEREEPNGGQRAVWCGQGRVVHEDWAVPRRVLRIPPPPYAMHEEVCDECRDGAHQDVLRGHFQPNRDQPA